MKQVYEIRERDMTGTLLGTVEVDVNERERCIEPGDHRGTGGIEVAAHRGASLRAVTRKFSGPVSGFGINRETGTPGLSGVFSLRGAGGSNRGAIHVSKASKVR
jgi:hypothetical protein